MSVLSVYIFKRVFWASGLSALGFISLFVFFDFIQLIGSGVSTEIGLSKTIITVALGAPDRLYELLPLSMLIGSLLAMFTLSQSSEYVVMRTSGLSTLRSSLLLCLAGLIYAVGAFLIGEFLVPQTNRLVAEMNLKSSSERTVFKSNRSGYWLKDQSNFVNFQEINNPGSISRISIFTFDQASKTLALETRARQADYDGESGWMLSGVHQILFEPNGVVVERKKNKKWNTKLSPDNLKLLLSEKEQMSFFEHLAYVNHLKASGQKFSVVEAELWEKISHPSLIVVLALFGLSITQTESRSRSMGRVLLIGVFIGVGLYFLNKFFVSVGSINNWPPSVYTFIPTLTVLVSLSIFLTVKESR